MLPSVPVRPEKSPGSIKLLLSRAIPLVLTAAFLCISISARAEISETDRAVAEQVFQQLLAAAPAPSGMSWPPKLEIIDKDEINAFATMRKKDGKEYPVVVCYAVLIKHDLEGNADRLP